MSRNPFDEIERMFDRMSRQFESFDDNLLESSVAVDVADTGDAFVLTADLPGFDTEDIDIEVTGDTLTISATHAEETEQEDEEGEEGQKQRYLRRERHQRSVSRSVRIPEPVDREDAEAEYHNGVLTITLPKQSAEDDDRNIPIN